MCAALAGCSMHGISPAGMAGNNAALRSNAVLPATAAAIGVAQPDVLDASAPRHVLTLDWLGGDSGTFAVPWATAAKHTTWAFTNAKDSVAIHDAGIHTLYYTQPNRQAPGEPEYSSDNSTFAHDCGGSRILTTNYANHYLMNPGSTYLGKLWQNEVKTVTGSWGGVFDAFFEDLSDTIVYTKNSPCDFDQVTWSLKSNNLVQNVTKLGYPVFYNGLAVFTKNGTQLGISPTMALNQTASGGMLEGCYVTSGDFPDLHLNTWIATEETELAMALAQKNFLCEGLDDNDASRSIPERLYYYASFLLTYDPSTSIDITEFKTPKDFHVLPETKFVPEAPVLSVSSVGQLLLSKNVYGRKYNDCYLGQVNVGACAVAINIDPSASHPFTWASSYRHTLSLSGYDIVDDGRATVTSPGPPSTLGPLTAVIAIH
jgi:hypothetical protein